MKKCTICLLGTWTVGLAAVGWGVMGALTVPITLPLWARLAAIIVGLTGLGFLFYQPPMKPCPRCLAANQTSQ